MPRLLTTGEFDSLARTAEELIFVGSRAEHANRLKRFKLNVSNLARELAPYPAGVLREMAQLVESACGRVRNKDHWRTQARSAIQKAKRYCMAAAPDDP